eukprot:scaffold11065_cov86-Skeletonema_dohrnii-CCMP3373.AAC.1
MTLQHSLSAGQQCSSILLRLKLKLKPETALVSSEVTPKRNMERKHCLSLINSHDDPIQFVHFTTEMTPISSFFIWDSIKVVCSDRKEWKTVLYVWAFKASS